MKKSIITLIIVVVIGIMAIISAWNISGYVVERHNDQVAQQMLKELCTDMGCDLIIDGELVVDNGREL